MSVYVKHIFSLCHLLLKSYHRVGIDRHVEADMKEQEHSGCCELWTWVWPRVAAGPLDVRSSHQGHERQQQTANSKYFNFILKNWFADLEGQ